MVHAAVEGERDKGGADGGGRCRRRLDDDDDVRPLEGMEKGVFTRQRYTPAPPWTDLDGNLRHSEALAKKIG